MGVSLVAFGQALLGTVRTPTTAMLMLLIIVAGQLFGRIGFALSTVSSSLVVLGLILAENASLLPEPDYVVNITQWISYTFIFFLTAVLTHYSFHKTASTLKTTIAEGEELHKTQTLLKQTQKLAKLGGWRWDIKAQKMFWTDETYQIHGIDPADIEAGAEEHIESGIRCYDEKDRPIIEEAFQKCANDGIAYDMEVPFTTLKGNRLWVRTVAHAEEENGEVVRVIGNIMDITERKQAEDALIESEEQFKLVMRQSPNVFELYDLDGLQIEVNKAYEKLWGFPASHTVNKFNVLESKEVVETGLISSIQKAYAGESVDVGEYQFDSTGATEADGPGRARWLKTIIYPLKDSQDKVKNIVITHEDVTERKLVEEALRKTEAIQSKMVANIGDVLVIIDQNGINQYKSPNVTTLFGWQPEELVGNSVWDNVHPDDRDSAQKFLANIAKASDAGGTTELRYKRKDALYVWIEVTVLNLLSDPDIQGFLGNYHDITERKQAEDQRISLEAQLHQSQKLESVGTMVGGISHELNNILQGMFLYSGIIEEQLPDDESLKGHFKQLQAGAEKARDIVKQILTFSRKAGVDMKPQRIHELIMGSLALERASIPANIDIKQDIDTNCGMVLCDKTQIHQIIINLCNNAEHAMKDRGGILSVSLQSAHKTISNADPAIDVLELTIRDTGHGIDAADLERIFDPFFTTKQVGEGTGLGLSVIHGIVEMMGGHISVTSEVDKGTTFSILFPVVDGVEDIHSTLKAIAAKDDPNMSILLVDDEQSIREVTQAILNRKGFAVESASDGQKAFDLFMTDPNKYNLIVTDLSMPIMSGIELCQAIRATGSNIPIMLSTGHLDIEDQKEYENVGITKSIKKPWTAEELIGQIHQLDHLNGPIKPR